MSNIEYLLLFFLGRRIWKNQNKYSIFEILNSTRPNRCTSYFLEVWIDSWVQTLIHTYKVVCGKLKRNDPPQFWKDKIADKKSYCCNVIDRRRGILIVPYCVPRYYVVCWLLRRAKKIRFHPNMDAAMAGRAHGGPRGLAGLPFSGAPVNDMVGFWQGENSLFLLPSGFFFFFFSLFWNSMK